MSQKREYAYSGLSSSPLAAKELEPVAQEIAIARGQCVAEAFFHMAALRSLRGDAPAIRVAPVTCPGAWVQDQQASEGNQAAHLLPGQILISGSPVWCLDGVALPSEVAPDRVQRLALSTQMCFARTTVLPAFFNRADSQAEMLASELGGGLKRLFGSTVQSLWSGARVDERRPLAIDRGMLLRALGGWFQTVNGVYQQAAERKRATASQASDSEIRQRRLNEAQVLSVYADSFRVAADPSRFVRNRLGWIDQLYPML